MEFPADLSVLRDADSGWVSWPPRPAELARWPIPWRERWGRLAVEMEEVLGLPWQEAEAEAYAQVCEEFVASGEPLLEPERERPEPTLGDFDRAFVPPMPCAVPAVGPVSEPVKRREPTPEAFPLFEGA